MRAYCVTQWRPCLSWGNFYYGNSSGGHTLRVIRKYLILLLRVNARPLWACDFSLSTAAGRNTLILPPPPPYNALYAPPSEYFAPPALVAFRTNSHHA